MSAGPWTRSAIRGLALLTALALALGGYWAWSGRPRAVAMVPEILATGADLPGDEAPVGEPVMAAEVAESAAPGDPAAVGAMPESGVDGPGAAESIVPELVVHVTGLVNRPGLVRLPPGSRVADAVDAAGGVTRRRAADSVNLARLVVDGEQIVVGGTAAPQTAAPTGTSAGAGPATGPLDLNTATQADLEELPGIGPVIAARIVQWRTDNGVFRSVDELGEVSGIGPAILSQVRSRVRV